MSNEHKPHIDSLTNFNHLKAGEMKWLYNNRCKAHGHRYISHINCYKKEFDLKEKIGFLDIETTNLNANWGIILSYCILPEEGNKPIKRLITRKELRSKTLDKDLVKDCVRDMCKFDRIVGHYSGRFDIPYIRTRALYWGVDFPKYKELVHTDVWMMARRLLRLHSNRQGVVAQMLQRENIKTAIDPELWVFALQGRQKALDTVMVHNVKDVLQLRGNFNALLPYANKTNRSL
jgi:uncharacterized protein YprB with RNaseH-like and TPR domain